MKRRGLLISLAVVVAGAALGTGLVMATADSPRGDTPVLEPPIIFVPDAAGAGVSESGAIRIPKLTGATRPVVVGREVKLAPVVQSQVAAKDAVLVSCMAANGAKVVERAPGLLGFDDPNGTAQAACSEESRRSDDFVMKSDGLRVAALAAHLLRTRIASCSRSKGHEDPAELTDADFDACVREGFAAIDS